MSDVERDVVALDEYGRMTLENFEKCKNSDR